MPDHRFSSEFRTQRCATGMALALVVVASLPQHACAQTVSDTASAALLPSQMAIVINIESPESIAVGDYYRQARKVPERNILHVRIPKSPKSLSALEFAPLREEILRQLPTDIEVIALAWTAPYAVECNSITSALSLGFDASMCTNTCAPGKLSPYFDHASVRPKSAPGFLPSMLLPADPVLMGVELIDRGVRSDGMAPQGTAYFLATSDPVRNTRVPFFPRNGMLTDSRLLLLNLQGDKLENRSDVMFYFTGTPRVSSLETLRFLPGAIADHLTSAGGYLQEDVQMSSLRWIQAGATATYGTVSEPCNYWQKFPHPGILLKHYLAGEPAVLAYWKSVAWPTQGVFVGEPLANPYRR